jgi:hypothetical protein
MDLAILPRPLVLMSWLPSLNWDSSQVKKVYNVHVQLEFKGKSETKGGGTIQAISTSMYVTASPNGDTPITASRQTVGSYEVFRFAPQGDGNYHMTAMVNRGLVTTGPDGGLVNNANSTNGIPPGVYKLVPTEHSVPVVLPPTATLRSVSNQRYVDSSVAGGRMTTTAATPGAATRYTFAKVNVKFKIDWNLFMFVCKKVADSPEEDPDWTLQSVATSQYVTGNAGGTIPLAAAAPAAQAWEYFKIVPYQGAYILIHTASGLATASQPDDTLQDNTNTINQAALWEITA